MSTIGILGAFLGGILTLISPCSALLLPAFFAYAFDGFGKLVSRTGLFYLGLCITLVPLGAGLGKLGSFLDSIRPTVMLCAGILIIIFGIMTVFGKGFAFRPAQDAVGKLSGTSAVSVLLLGCVYGLASFCSGPILGSILTVAMAGGSALYGMVLMAVYALGMAVPLFILAILWERFDLSHKKWIHGKELKWGPITTNTTSLISGALFIFIGALFLATDGTAGINTGGDGTNQFDAELWVTRVGNSSTDLIVLLVVLVLLLIALVAYMVRRKHTSGAGVDDDAEDSTDSSADDGVDGAGRGAGRSAGRDTGRGAGHGTGRGTRNSKNGEESTGGSTGIDARDIADQLDKLAERDASDSHTI